MRVASGGVAGEGHAGAAVVASVAEDHGLDVDGGAPIAGNIVHTAVDNGPLVVPGAEHRLDGAHQLLFGVGGEIHAQLGLVFRLKLLGQLFQVVGVQLGIQLDAFFFLHLVDELFKILFAHFHHNVGIHLDKPAIAVVGKTGVIGDFGKRLHDLVVQTQVENGVHHAGHRGPGAGTDGNQQRVLRVAEGLAGNLLHLGQIFIDLVLDILGDLLAVFIVPGAGLGGNGEALGHRHTKIGHLGQVSAFAAQQLPHIPVALREKVNVLMHCDTLLMRSAFYCQ